MLVVKSSQLNRECPYIAGSGPVLTHAWPSGSVVRLTCVTLCCQAVPYGFHFVATWSNAPLMALLAAALWINQPRP